MSADLVFLGGRAFTGDAVGAFTDALAVRAGRVMALGQDAVTGLVGPGTRVVDLAGGLLIPGFQDAHSHPVQGGTERMRCDLSAGASRGDYLSAVAAYVHDHRDVEWVTGGGWSMAAFPASGPAREDLDAVVRDRPALLLNRDHHGAWVNSRALDLAGVDERTPDPPDGRIERGPGDVPSGMLHEGAMALVARLVPQLTPEEQLQALLEAQRYLHSLGITAWQDAILGEYAGHGDASPAYVAAAGSGDLTARVVGALWWDRERGAEQVDELAERRERLGTGRFRATSVKIMQDGIAEHFTAAML